MPGVPHDHSHASERVPVAPPVQRLLAVGLAPFIVATLVGLVVLWPGDRSIDVSGSQPLTERFDAVVTTIEPLTCPEVPGQENFICTHVTVELTEGSDDGDTFSFDYSRAPNSRAMSEGDRVVVGRGEQSPTDTEAHYFFVDFDRRAPLLALGILFAVVVVALSRWRGLAALAGVVVSLMVLVKFVLPAILAGHSPLAVASVGAAVIMFLALYLAHGLNAATTVAVLGTLASLLLTGLLSVIFVGVSSFTGSSSEEAVFLQISQQQVNLEGLLLASIIIGTLGVLDDVTVTQASAVWEIRRANPGYGIKKLYQAGIRIGRDHIASTVNTLVLAYAGASLPLLVLFTVANRSFTDVVTTELMAEEVVRTLVGSIGLIASVPLTTGLAAFVVSRGAGRAPTPPRRPRLGPKDEEEFKLPRAEAEWREDA
jgi:uncharacterized membrane protein